MNPVLLEEFVYSNSGAWIYQQKEKILRTFFGVHGDKFQLFANQASLSMIFETERIDYIIKD